MSACSCEEYFRNQASSGTVKSGGHFPVYRKYQSGGGIFSTLIRFLRPVIRAAAPIAKTVLKKVGKTVAEAALPALAQESISAITDLAQGQNVKEVVKRRVKNIAKSTGSRLAKKTQEHLQKIVENQRGSGIKRKPKSANRYKNKRSVNNTISNF
jgi:hypothetical protein